MVSHVSRTENDPHAACFPHLCESMYNNFVENRFSGGRPIYTYGMVWLHGAGTSWFCVHRFARGDAQQTSSPSPENN